MRKVKPKNYSKCENAPTIAAADRGPPLAGQVAAVPGGAPPRKGGAPLRRAAAAPGGALEICTHDASAHVTDRMRGRAACGAPLPLQRAAGRSAAAAAPPQRGRAERRPSRCLQRAPAWLHNDVPRSHRQRCRPSPRAAGGRSSAACRGNVLASASVGEGGPSHMPGGALNAAPRISCCVRAESQRSCLGGGQGPKCVRHAGHC